MNTPPLNQAESMAEPKEVAEASVAARHARRVAEAAAALRANAQLQYDIAVAAKQSAVQAHVDALNALDRASAGVGPEAAAVLASMRQTAVASHIAAIETLSATVADLTPQLDVAYWADAAETQIAALEADGR